MLPWLFLGLPGSAPPSLRALLSWGRTLSTAGVEPVVPPHRSARQLAGSRGALGSCRGRAGRGPCPPAAVELCAGLAAPRLPGPFARVVAWCSLC